ncbi:MAG: extracellular solute-binding protein [Ruminococcus sp.]|nr:extracellular solute-binding protein [Ruminococcus sp.]
MKKIVALVLAAMMIVAAFASCGGGDNQSNSGSDNGSTANSGTDQGTGFNVDAADFGDESNATLKVWGPDAYVKLLKKQCDAFTKKFPDKNIKINVVAQGEDTAATNMLSDADAAADVFGFASDQLSRLVSAGVIAPVATKYAEAITSSNLKAAVSASTLQNPETKKDTLYAFPETGNGYYLVYDKSVVSDKDAGSLEAILADCKKAGKKFIMDAGNGYYACIFPFTGGVKIEGLEEDGLTQKFNDYDEAKVVATLKAFSKLMHEYSGTFTSLDVANISSGFVSTSKKKSVCGAGIDGNWNSTPDQEALGDNFGAAKLPTIKVDGKEEQMVSMYGYKMIGVNNASKFPRTAQILAYYLSSEECQTQRCEELGWSPTNNTVVESDVAKKNVAISALVAQSEFSVAQVNIAQTFWDPMGNLGNKLIAEDTNPDKYDFKKLFQNTISNIKDE